MKKTNVAQITEAENGYIVTENYNELWLETDLEGVAKRLAVIFES